MLSIMEASDIFDPFFVLVSKRLDIPILLPWYFCFAVWYVMSELLDCGICSNICFHQEVTIMNIIALVISNQCLYLLLYVILRHLLAEIFFLYVSLALEHNIVFVVMNCIVTFSSNLLNNFISMYLKIIRNASCTKMLSDAILYSKRGCLGPPTYFSTAIFFEITVPKQWA